MSFLIDAFRKECVHSIIELLVRVLGDVYFLIKPNSFTKNVDCLLVNSLPQSLKIYLLPPKVEYIPVI